ncbi:hypothetical protein [Microbulbifer sp. THAF38]|uniref:hypothetical protein n=1 Tax=Microbulbifer sp. THAF38 TaxID=2587856 RepID=UPI00126876B3|nr:hypothetical protein [Microbulbifer sp. THAF38]QFT57140.1 hypothetical protein FIU95_21545 [Microbulbifer sp. THAF38]
MFRIVVGFILGAISTFYILPFIESGTGKLPRPDIGGIFSSDKNHHSSNIINSVPPSDYRQSINQKLDADVMTAISVTRTRSLNEQASSYVVKLITNLIEQEPGIQTFVRERLDNGITNREALEIFEKYYSVKG